MEIQTFAKNVGDYGCLALVYLKAACLLTGTQWDEMKALVVIKEAMRLKYIDEDCYVRNPVGLMKLATGKTFDVSKTSIGHSRSPYVAMRYECGTKAHWTLWSCNSGLIWNSLDYSNCVVNGNPVLNDVRDIVLRG